MKRPEPAPIPRLALTIPEAAKAIRVSERTLWLEIKLGRIRVHRVRRRTLIRPSDLEEYLKRAAA